MLLQPNNNFGHDVGLFLEAVPDGSGVLAPRRCTFVLAALRDSGLSARKHSQHDFTASNTDWCGETRRKRRRGESLQRRDSAG